MMRTDTLSQFILKCCFKPLHFHNPARGWDAVCKHCAMPATNSRERLCSTLGSRFRLDSCPPPSSHLEIVTGFTNKLPRRPWDKLSTDCPAQQLYISIVIPWVMNGNASGILNDIPSHIRHVIMSLTYKNPPLLIYTYLWFSRVFYLFAWVCLFSFFGTRFPNGLKFTR